MSTDPLRRSEWRDPIGSDAVCITNCGPLAEGVSPQAAARLAGEHTRETGHVTRANHGQIVEYRPSTPAAGKEAP